MASRGGSLLTVTVTDLALKRSTAAAAINSITRVTPYVNTRRRNKAAITYDHRYAELADGIIN